MNPISCRTGIRLAVVAGVSFAMAFLSACGRREAPPAPAAGSGPTNAPAPAAAPRLPTAEALPADAFLEAAMEGQEGVVAKALEAGTYADVAGEQGRTALMMAAFNGHSAVCRRLLDAKASVTAKDAMGRTALLYASTGPDVETVRLLLDAGSDVNVVDIAEHWTPLMFAAAEGNQPVVELLLLRGADPIPKDIDGDNAEAFALQKGHTAVAALLKEAAAKRAGSGK